VRRELILGVLGWLVTGPLWLGPAAWWLRRRSSGAYRVVLRRALGAGVFLGLISLVLEGLVLRYAAGVHAPIGAGALPIFVAVSFVGPLEESLKLAAVWPAFRRRELDGPREGVQVAMAAAVGLSLVETAWATAASPGLSWLDLGAFTLAHGLQMMLGAVWGYLLGSSRRRSQPRQGFLGAWLVVAIAHGVVDHLLSLGTARGLGVAAVLLGALALLGWPVRSELRRPSGGRSTVRIRPLSLSEVHELAAIERRPLSLRWVAMGVLVHQGALVLAMTLAIVGGRRLGVDFAAAAGAGAAASGPLLYLGSVGAASFAVTGFLVAKASGLSGLLEPALAAALALVVLCFVLGVASSVGVAVTLASAPVALVLACAGAWVGSAR
jgi:hypothetical protein